MGNVLRLDPDESRAAEELSLEIASQFHSVNDPELLFALPHYAARLPDRPRPFLRAFALNEISGYCIIGGHHVDQERIGATPRHWQGRDRPGPEFPEEILLLLYAACIGEPFGWRTQQDGELVHDVFPIREFENEQLGTGSKELLTWHTEDAFHPCRADYLILYCLRNPQSVATTVGELDLSALDADLDVLFQERFYIKPDQSHLPKNNSQDASSDELFAAIERMNEKPEPVAVLYGSRQRPYLRLDPYFMFVPGDDPQAAEAFERLVAVLDRALRDVALGTGDALFVNNHLAVHGRKPFSPLYDGSDRWLKRVNVTTDLRKSRALRTNATDRIIG